MEPKKPQTFQPEDPFLTMSFGNKDFQKALGFDIQQLLDKGLNNKALTEDTSAGNNINIIGNVNYENINFNFTFAKTENPEEKIQNTSKSPLPKRKLINAKEKEKPANQDQSEFRSPYSETEISFNKINMSY